MTNKQIIIDGENIERIKTLLFEGQREAISTKTFEAIIEALESKEQECERLKLEINSYVTITDECLRLDNKRLADEKRDLQQQLDQLKVEQERLEEVNKELQYQLGCVTGREREHKANSDFWCKRCEDLQQKIDQLQPQVNTPTATKEKLLIDKDTIEESLKIVIDENNRLKHELSVYGATGICETCTDKALLENDKLKQTLVKVKNMIEKSRDKLYDCDSIICADDRLVEILDVINEVLPHDNQQ